MMIRANEHLAPTQGSPILLVFSPRAEPRIRLGVLIRREAGRTHEEVQIHG